MNSTAVRSDVGVVKRTTRTPSVVVVAPTTEMLSGMGRSNGTFCSAFVIAAPVADGVGAIVGQVGVDTVDGVDCDVGALLLPLQPTARVATSAAAAVATTRRPVREDVRFGGCTQRG